MRAPSRFRPAIVPLLLLAAACGGDSDGPSGPVDEGQTPVAGCSDGTMSSGALYRICFPPGWNGELVIYAHGYVRPDEPLAIPDDALAGISVSSAVTSLGYAYATTSYRANGLVADIAVDDLLDLDDRFRQLYRPDPTLTYVVGASEGGLAAALAAELDPARFSGVLAACGPIGDFATQVDYFGDFRVVFDFFFPDVLPGSAVEVPDELRANWESQYIPDILAALASDPASALELIQVTGAPVDDNDVASIGETVIGLLWYSVFATEDAQLRLGGQPFDNSTREYTGSSDDLVLNAAVVPLYGGPRRAAGDRPLQRVGRSRTSGGHAAYHRRSDRPVPARVAVCREGFQRGSHGTADATERRSVRPLRVRAGGGSVGLRDARPARLRGGRGSPIGRRATRRSSPIPTDCSGPKSSRRFAR